MSRRQTRSPDLTSLIDVLFILVFAALIQTAGAHAPEEAAAAPEATTAPDAGVPAPIPTPQHAALRARALAELTSDLAGRTVAVARVSRDGVLTELELPGERIELGVPLVEASPDPDIVLVYPGDRSPDLRVCRIAALRLGVPDLSEHIVVITPEVPVRDLTVALAEGLDRDVNRCLDDQRSLAILVDPSTLPQAPP
jgi:hypothetical protein